MRKIRHLHDLTSLIANITYHYIALADDNRQRSAYLGRRVSGKPALESDALSFVRYLRLRLADHRGRHRFVRLVQRCGTRPDEMRAATRHYHTHTHTHKHGRAGSMRIVSVAPRRSSPSSTTSVASLVAVPNALRSTAVYVPVSSGYTSRIASEHPPVAGSRRCAKSADAWIATLSRNHVTFGGGLPAATHSKVAGSPSRTRRGRRSRAKVGGTAAPCQSSAGGGRAGKGGGMHKRIERGTRFK